MPTFHAIAAMARNRVIGSGNTIPWKLPGDFRWFRQKTMGKAVLMGRRTFESLGKPLLGRLNIVLSRNPEATAQLTAFSKAEAKTGSAALAVLRRFLTSDTESTPHLPGLPPPPHLLVLANLDLIKSDLPGEIWVIGGSNVYQQLLPVCEDLFLSHVDAEPEGDVFFPAFEADFDDVGEVLREPGFSVHRYRRRTTVTGADR